MKTNTTIKTNLDNFKFGYWDDHKEEFIPIEDMTPEIAAQFGLSERFMEALTMTLEMLSECTRLDLVQIWHRLDRLESRMDARLTVVMPEPVQQAMKAGRR